MALNKKRVTKAKKDELRKDDLAEKKAASRKAKAKLERKSKVTAESKLMGEPKAAAKPTVTRLPKVTAKPEATPEPKVTAKSKNRKPVKVPKEGVGGSNATDDSGTTGQRLAAGGITMEQEVDPLEVDPFILAKQTMKGSVPAIVEAMVKLAKQGSHSHAKTLLEMTGAKHMFEGESEVQGSSEPWAKLVLERLEEAEIQGEQETVRHPEESVLIPE